MAKLNQVIAIEKGIKGRTKGIIDELYKAVQKAELFDGFSKTYASLKDDGEKFPPERKKVQFAVHEVLKNVSKSATEAFDITARKDWTNAVASADVTVDGVVVVKDAPVTFLLFLEKELVDMRTFISKLPVLDNSEEWSQDANAGLYKTEAIQTHKTKKMEKPIVLYQATDKHPAQTQLITSDELIGYWSTIKQSGAIPKPLKETLADRIEKLINAVKEAREAANNADEVDSPKVGDAIFGYLFKE